MESASNFTPWSIQARSRSISARVSRGPRAGMILFGSPPETSLRR